MEQKPVRILLIEDEAVFAEVVKALLDAFSPVPFLLTEAQTIRGGLARLSPDGFDVILLDLGLPDSDGLETFQGVHQKAPGTAIVVLTGTDDDTVALEAVRQGAQDYLVKGQINDGRMLWRVIRYAIERKRSAETLREREEFFRLITENVNDLISVTGRDGSRLYNSASYRRVLADPGKLRGTNAFVEIHPEDRERLKAIFEQTVATGQGQRTEFRFLRGDGAIRYIESEGTVIKDANSQVSKVVVVSRDITERKEAEEALRQSEQRYKRLLDSTTDYIYTVGLDQGRPVATTHGPGCVAVTGYAPEDYSADPDLWYKMVHAEDRPMVLEQAARARAGEACPPLEHRILHKDGSIRWVRNTTVSRRDQKGRLVAYDGLVTNITARRSAEERLRQSEALYHSLVESLPQNIFRKDVEGRFTFVNHRFAELMGRSAIDILGKTDLDFFPRELAEKYRRDDRQVMETGKILELVEENRSPAGLLTHVRVVKIPTYDPQGRVTGIQGIFWDITEQLRAEQELRRSEQRLESIMDNSTAVIYLKDLEFRYQFINRQFERLFHVTKGRLVGKTDFDIFPKPMADLFRANDRRVIEEKTALELDEVAPHDDGVHSYISLKFPLCDSRGQPYALCGISTDITERKHAEERQAVQYAVARALADSGSLREAVPRVLQSICDRLEWDIGAYWVVDHEAGVLRCVETCQRRGVRARAFAAHSRQATFASGEGFPGHLWKTGKPVWVQDLAANVDCPRAALAVRSGMHAAFGFPIHIDDRVLGIIEFFSREMRRPDGEMMQMFTAVGSQIGQFTDRKLGEERLQRAYSELARSQEEVLKANADLQRSHEDLLTTQAQLIQAEKLQSVGTLAAGIAHEVKNPLQIILMGVRYLSQQVPSGDENVHLVLHELRSAVGRADRIIRDLLEFTRLGQLALRDDDLHAVIEQSLRLVNFEIASAQINVVREKDPVLPPLRLDRNKMEQVFINLLMNAAHAMPRGGTIRIRTFTRQIAAHERIPGVGQTAHWRAGETVAVVELEDTGAGIPEDKLHKIFDPFFTTKPTGQGTGLGLWVVKNIIELHGGTINILNRPEGGVRVTITLKTERRTDP